MKRERSRNTITERLPTNAKTWKKLRVEWLSALIQHLDNDWLDKVARDGATVDRETLEAILHCAVGVLPDNELGSYRFREDLFHAMSELYHARGRPLQALPLSHFLRCPATEGQFSQSTSQPSQLGRSNYEGQASKANDEGPELAWTPDNLPFLRMGQQSVFLLTKKHGGADDWMLGSCSLGALVFSPSMGMAQLVSHVLATPGQSWPVLPPPATLRQPVQQSQGAPGVPCSPKPMPRQSYPQTPALGHGSRGVPDMGSRQIISPMSS